MTRVEVLEAAISIGESEDRKTKYGKPENSFQKIADFWNAYLRGQKRECEITDVDVGVMMGLMKIARISTGVQQDDSFVDAVNYLALASDLIETKANTVNS